MSTEDPVQQRFEKVKQLRDEVRVQVDLGKMELRDQWEKVESQFQGAQGRLARLMDKGEETTEHFRQETVQIIDNVRERLEGLRKK